MPSSKSGTLAHLYASEEAKDAMTITRNPHKAMST